MTNRDNAVDEIKSRCDIVEVIGQVVPLKKAGSNYKGNCPFHNEKTPSFVVSQTKQIFTCFGCGVTGDVIGFVQQYYQLDFIGAMEKLMADYNINIQLNFNKSPHKDESYSINKEAAKFFYKALRAKENPAFSYMEKRGISTDTLNLFGIGYADDQWNSLHDHLKSLGFEDNKLMDLGLISQSKGKYYDKFRNRVMFPIINTSGKVIGFGGRILDDGAPKYLNSNESDIFLKKNNLYGLNLTRQDISKENEAILVEGYMDVISLYQGGVRNVSASLGTALTESQAKMLKRYTNQVVLAYDSDQAGISAALRGLDILHKENCKVKVLQVTEGKDPDEYIKSHGKQGFLNLVSQALPYADYKFSLLKKEYDLDTTQGRVDFLQSAVSVLQMLSPVEADIYIRKLAKETNISQGAIRLELDGNNRQEKPSQLRPIVEDHIPKQASMLEKNVIKLILTSSGYFPKFDIYANAVFISECGQMIYAGIKGLYKQDEELDVKKLADSLDTEYVDELQDILDNIQLAHREKEVYGQCVHTIKTKALAAKEKELISRLSMADEEENKENIEHITKELMEIQRTMRGNRG
ncbi:MAG: DNA primase [Anaerovoracaceae bacterium]